MKRTTLVLDERAYTDLKKRAAEEGRTVSDLVNDFIRAGLQRPDRTSRRRPRLPAYSMGSSAVNLADRDALSDRMGGR
jgi:hypothetical protein